MYYKALKCSMRRYWCITTNHLQFYLFIFSSHFHWHTLIFLLFLTGRNLLQVYLDMPLSASDREKLIIVSDGVGLSPEVLDFFKHRNKLHLAIVTLYQDPSGLPDYKEYVRKRFSDTSGIKKPTDAWIQQYKDGCVNEGCGVYTITSSVDNVSEVMKAVASLLIGFNKTRSNICGNSEGLCDGLTDSSNFYHQIWNSIQNISEDVSINQWRARLMFNSAGGILRSDKHPLYTLSTVLQRGTNWVYEKIADYHSNGTLKFKDQSKNRLPTLISRCTGNCSKCHPKIPMYHFEKRTSDYIIAGTGPLHKKKNQHECEESINESFFLRMQAFYYAVNYIRNITGINFSSLFIDTCYATLATHLTLARIFTSNTECVLVSDDGTVHTFPPSRFVVFIGDSSSGISLSLQNYLGPYKIPQISYASTSAWLNDRQRYPLFLRNVPSDDAQALAIIKLVMKHGWKSVGLIYTNTVYGGNGGDQLKQYAKAYDICISYEFKINTKSEVVYKDLVLGMKSRGVEGRLPQPIIIFGEYYALVKVTNAIGIYDPEWKSRGNFFIASETWNNNPDFISISGGLFAGTLSISLPDNIYNWTTASGNQLQQYVEVHSSKSLLDDRWFRQFWEQYFKCHLDIPQGLPGSCKGSYSLAATTLNFEGVTAKHIVAAGLSVAYSIREAEYGEQVCDPNTDCSVLFTSEGKKVFFRLLKQTMIPTMAGSHAKVNRPFTDFGNGRENYLVYNIIRQSNKNEYQLVYTISDGNIISNATPIFYKNGHPTLSVSSPVCEKCSCSGISDMQKDNSTGVSKTPTELKKQDVLIILIFVLVILAFLIAVIAWFTVTAFRKNRLLNGKYSS